jgi:hypothetical protein
MKKTKLLVDEETKGEGEGKGFMTKNKWTLKKKMKVKNEKHTDLGRKKRGSIKDI